MQNCKCTESARSTDWMCQFSHFFHPRTKFLRTRPTGFALNHSYSISLHLFFQERRQEDQSINIAMWRMIDSALHLVLPPSEVRNPLRQPVYQRTDSPLFIFCQSDGEDQIPIAVFAWLWLMTGADLLWENNAADWLVADGWCQGRSQMIMLSGSFLFLAGVFSFKKQCRTVILIDFVEIRRGRLTPTQPRSSAPA